MTQTLNLVFMGTPDFAVPALRALHEAGHNIKAVYCQPPKPTGRGHKVKKTPMHLSADDLGIQVCTPKSLRGEDAQKELASFNADLIIVAAYGLILPQAVLDMPKHGCLNIHGSLLPRWRGAAPIHRALLAGDRETGITIMQMDAGLDTGDMLLKEQIPITKETTAQTLHDSMAELGAKLIVDAVAQLTQGTLTATPQPEEGTCYADKLKREEGLVDWSKPALEVERQVRALTPWPGTFFNIDNVKIKLHKATLIDNLSGEAGTLLNDDFTIACGSGALRLDSVQKPGKKPTDGASMLRGLRIKVGTKIA